MSNELQSQKQEVQRREGIERTRAARVYIPHVDIYTVDDEIVLLAEMPGVDESEVDITLEKNVLTMTGYCNVDVPEDYDLAHSEYGIGDYQRSFTLSDEVDRDNIEASMSNGVLRVIIPRAPEAKSKKIEVKPA